jgi:hypothetical protein
MICWTRGNRSHALPAIGGEAGVALAAAVFALALIGALVASVFFAGRLEQQSGQNMYFAVQAREAADAGLAQALAAVDAGALEQLVPGGVPLDLGTVAVGEGATVHSQAVRLTSRLYLLRARGIRHDAAGAALAARSLGLLVHLVGTTPAPERLSERGWIRLY